MDSSTNAPWKFWAKFCNNDGPYLITDSNMATFRAVAAGGGRNRVWRACGRMTQASGS